MSLNMQFLMIHMTFWGEREFHSLLRKLGQHYTAGCFQNILTENVKTRIGEKKRKEKKKEKEREKEKEEKNRSTLCRGDSGFQKFC